jgi:hypothetical protein
MYLIFWKIVLNINSFGANSAWFCWNIFSSCCILNHSYAISSHQWCSLRCSLVSSDFHLSQICWSNWIYGKVNCHLERTTSINNACLPFNISNYSHIYSDSYILWHIEMSLFSKYFKMSHTSKYDHIPLFFFSSFNQWVCHIRYVTCYHYFNPNKIQLEANVTSFILINRK